LVKCPPAIKHRSHVRIVSGAPAESMIYELLSARRASQCPQNVRVIPFAQRSALQPVPGLAQSREPPANDNVAREARAKGIATASPAGAARPHQSPTCGNVRTRRPNSGCGWPRQPRANHRHRRQSRSGQRGGKPGVASAAEKVGPDRRDLRTFPQSSVLIPKSASFYAFAARVRRQKRWIVARMSLAVLVQRKGFGSALVASM
jgi:hypothetical protein